MLALMLILILGGCGINKQTLNFNKPIRHEKKMSASKQKKMLETLYSMNVYVAYYDNYIGNIGYNVTDNMNSDTLAAIQDATSNVLVKPRDTALKEKDDGIKALNSYPLSKTDVNRFISDYKKIQNYQLGWISALEGLNETNADEVMKTLAANQTGYRDVSGQLAKDMETLLMDSGMTKANADRTLKSMDKKLVKEVGDPTDSEKLN